MSSDVLEFLKQNDIEIDETVIESLKREKVTLASLHLMEESDLKELGFAMGPRKLLTDIINKANACEAEKSPRHLQM